MTIHSLIVKKKGRRVNISHIVLLIFIVCSKLYVQKCCNLCQWAFIVKILNPLTIKSAQARAMLVRLLRTTSLRHCSGHLDLKVETSGLLMASVSITFF